MVLHKKSFAWFPIILCYIYFDWCVSEVKLNKFGEWLKIVKLVISTFKIPDAKFLNKFAMDLDDRATASSRLTEIQN